MNMEGALSAVPEAPEARGDPEEVAVDEVADDPGEGVEVLLLCSLLYARGPAVRRVIDALTAADFHSAIHSSLFEAISELVGAGHRTTPIWSSTTCAVKGRSGDIRAASSRRR